MANQTRLTTYIDSKLHIDIKVYAAKTKKSMSSIVETALKEYMERNPIKE